MSASHRPDELDDAARSIDLELVTVVVFPFGHERRFTAPRWVAGYVTRQAAQLCARRNDAARAWPLGALFGFGIGLALVGLAHGHAVWFVGGLFLSAGSSFVGRFLAWLDGAPFPHRLNS